MIPHTVMYIALESTAGLHLDFELPPEGSSIIIQTPNPYDFTFLLIEQGKWGKDECLVSLVVRGAVYHHESDTKFRCKMKRVMKRTIVPTTGQFSPGNNVNGRDECQWQSVDGLTSPISSARIPPRRV